MDRFSSFRPPGAPGAADGVGQDMALQVEHILLQLRDMGLAGSGDTGLPVVRTGVINLFARLWMIPNIARLEGEPKDLHMLLDINFRLMPLAADRIAIRYISGPWPGSQSIPLAARCSVLTPRSRWPTYCSGSGPTKYPRSPTDTRSS